VSNPLFIIRAGGFGREVFSIIEALRATSHLQPIAGFIDDKPLGPINHVLPHERGPDP
jgi:hypothetical protein